MPRVPSLSSKELTRLLERGGAVQIGKKSLDPAYCKRVLRQLRFTDVEIEDLLKNRFIAG